MLNRFIDKLMPDVPGEQAPRARLLINVSLMGAAAITGFMVLMCINTLAGQIEFSDFMPQAFVQVASLCALALMLRVHYKGHIEAASRLLIGGLLVAVFASIYIDGDPPTNIAGAMVLLLTTTLATALLEKRKARAIFLFTWAIYIGLFMLWRSGYLPEPATHTPYRLMIRVAIWGVIAGIVMDTAVVGWEYLRDHTNTLEQRTAELTTANEQLRQEIAERKQIEIILSNSEERYKELFENTGTAIVIIDKDGIYQLANKQAALNFGMDPEEIVGKSIFDMFPREVAESYLESNRKLIESGTGREYESTVDLPRGTKTFLTIERCIKDYFGDGIAIQISNVDITERKQAEEALRESEERWRAIYEAARDGIFIINMQGEYIDVNPFGCQMFGYERQEIVTSDLTLLSTHSSDITTLIERSKQLWQEGGFVPEMPLRKKDGSVVWVSMTVAPITLAGETLVIGIAHDVTERKHTEDTLHDYERIVSATPDLITMIDRNYIFRAANKAYLLAHKKEYDEIVGHHVGEISGEDVLQNIAKQYIDKCLTGEHVHYQIWHEYEDKGRLFLSNSYSPCIEADGRISGIVSIVRDITELKRSEEALRESEERYALVVRGANDGIWDNDFVKGKAYYSPRYMEIIGYEPHEIPYGPEEWQKRIHPDDLERTLEINQRCIDGETDQFEAEYRLQHKDGSWCWILSRGASLKDESGKVYRFAGTHTDITERKNMEQAVRDSEERYALVVRGANDGIWDWNVATGEGYYSPRYMEILGYEPHEFPHKGDEWRKRIHPNDLERALETNQRCIDGENDYIAIEYRMQHKNGSWRWILGRGAILKDESGKVYRFAGTHTDITEKKNAENERLRLTQLRAELVEQQKLLDLKESFVTLISHEFRTPLSIIISSKELLTKYFDRLSPEGRQGHLEKIDYQVKRMVDILEDILVLSKASTEMAGFHPTPVNVEQLCLEMIDIYRGTYEDAPPLSFNNISEWDNKCMLDDSLMHYILSNLLSNAIKFSPNGDEIVTTLQREDDEIVIQIIDKGVGIPADEQDKIFEPFYRAKNAEHMQGTGAGLAIAKHCVDTHKGTITMESLEGKGSTFTVRIPFNEAP
jgi:PAS domain S-box-containing protein